MPAPRPVTDEERAEIRKLHAQGLTLRKMAEHLDRSAGGLSRICANMGLTFDRTTTDAATAAAVSDNRARRAKLVTALLDEVEAAVQILQAGRGAAHGEGEFLTLVRDTGGAERVDELSFVPSQDWLNLMRAASTAAKTATDLEKVDSSAEVGAAVSAIGQIGDALAAVAKSFESGDDA